MIAFSYYTLKDRSLMSKKGKREINQRKLEKNGKHARQIPYMISGYGHVWIKTRLILFVVVIDKNEMNIYVCYGGLLSGAKDRKGQSDSVITFGLRVGPSLNVDLS